MNTMNKELELEAMDILKNKWSHLYQFGYPKKPFPTNYENDLNNVMLNLTSKYVEKEKLKFAIEQIKSLEPSDYDVEYGSSDLRHLRNILRKKRIELIEQLKGL